MASVSDADLLQASRGGDERAFALLVDRYKGLVSALTYSATCDLGLSHDLAQETFTVAWRKLDHLQEPGKLRAWLCGIARHLALQSLRSRRRNPIHGASPLQAVPEPATTRPTPRDAAVAGERAAVVAAALAQLPEEYRLPLVLYYYEGRSARAVAEALGISEENVRQRLVRGRQRLREHVFAMVGDTLERTRPGRAFVLTVLGRLGRPAPVPVPMTYTGAGVAKAVLAGASAVVLAAAGWFAWSGAAPVAEPAHSEAATKAPAEATVPIEPVSAASQAVMPMPEPVPADEEKTRRDEEGIRLATSILNRAWVMQPMEAARGLCIEAWAYRAALGDTQCREKLVAEVQKLGEGAIRANQMLQGVLYDTDYLRDVYARCTDPSLPDDVRRGHIITLFFGDPLPGAAPPPEVVDACVSLVERDGPAQAPMRFLEKTATERARPLAEYYLLASANDSSTPEGRAVHSTSGSFRALESTGSPGLSSICLEDSCLAIIRQIGNPKSCEAVRSYLQAGEHVDRPLAALTLWELGAAEEGLALLRECLDDAEGDTERLRCAWTLAKAGDAEGIRVLKAATENGNLAVRVDAYAHLCSLGNPAFIEPLLHDCMNLDSLDFHKIRLCDPETFKRTDAGVRSVSSPPLLELCARMAELPELKATLTTPAAGNVLIKALSSLHDAPVEYARRALPACLPALDLPAYAIRGMEGRDQAIHAERLIFLMRWGDESTRGRVAAYMKESMAADPLFQDALAFSLKWAVHREAEPILVSIMEGCPRENNRVTAAVSYLAIRSGKRL